MAIPREGCFDYTAVLTADAGAWIGTATDDGGPSLVGTRPAVRLAAGRLTFQTRRGWAWTPPLARTADLAVGDAPEAVMRPGDRLSCRRDCSGTIGLSLIRDDRLLLALGTSADMGDVAIALHLDPRIEETELARTVRYVTEPGAEVFWLDPATPAAMEARLRELDQGRPGVRLHAIVVRSDDRAQQAFLNERTMEYDHREGASVFYAVSEQYATLDQWLARGRSLSPEWPTDLVLGVRIRGTEHWIPEGGTASIDGWLVHVHRVFKAGGIDGGPFVGLVRADAGIATTMLEASTAAVARGVRMERASS